MQTQLLPIFQLRELCLAAINPTFYKQNAELIRRSALAAQDYILNGIYHREYHTHIGRNFKHLPGYKEVHKKYDIPYDPYNTAGNPTAINPGLVMDLAWSFNSDTINGIISPQGDIKNPARLRDSEIMAVYHCSPVSGTPASAFTLLVPSQMDKLIASAQKTK